MIHPYHWYENSVYKRNGRPNKICTADPDAIGAPEGITRALNLLPELLTVLRNIVDLRDKRHRLIHTMGGDATTAQLARDAEHFRRSVQWAEEVLKEAAKPVLPQL